MHGAVWLPMVAALAGAAPGGAPARSVPPPALVWQAPAGCPRAADVRGNVARILAESAHAQKPVAITARVVVTAGDPWQAFVVLDVDNLRTERRFQAESCDAIAAATALIVALAADDELEPAPPESPAPPPPPPAPASVEPPPADAASTPVLVAAPPPVAARRWDRTLLVGAEGLIDWGTLPSGPAAGFAVGAGPRWTADRWRVRAQAGASFFPGTQLVYSPTGGFVFADFWLFDLSARGCAAAAFWKFELGTCLGAELDVMHGSPSASNPGAVKTQTRPWLSAVGSAVAALNLFGSLVVSLRADLVVPTHHANFGTPDVDVILYEIPNVACRAALSLEHPF